MHALMEQLTSDRIGGAGLVLAYAAGSLAGTMLAVATLLAITG